MTPWRKSCYRCRQGLSACALNVGSGLQKDPGCIVRKAFQCIADLTKELLQGVPARPPDSKLLDYWATLSSCLTNLDLEVDRSHSPLQPAYLKELTGLTRLSFHERNDTIDDADEEEWPDYAFEFPVLKLLEFGYLQVGSMNMQCPQLYNLSIKDCIMGKLHIQASLKDLYISDSTYALLHEGFPMSNLSGVTNLRLDGNHDIGSEAGLFQRLPLMTLLQILHLGVGQCKLPANLPSSLRDLTIVFNTDRAWDSSVIPLVQSLPIVETIRIYIRSQHDDSIAIGDKSLDHDLRPFLAMSLLRHLQFSKPFYWDEKASQLWKASALRQFGELEAEVLRLGHKLQLRY